MRDHSSHDILLMCYNCHTYSNLFDLALRRDLAMECDAPINSSVDVKVREVDGARTVRSAARAIIKDTSNKIPAVRKESLRKVLKDHFDVEELTEEMLRKAENLEPT